MYEAHRAWAYFPGHALTRSWAAVTGRPQTGQVSTIEARHPIPLSALFTARSSIAIETRTGR